ncbi:glutamate racemase [Terriglobus roseus DSM 18391]|uniref:Glutamate racemase n=1 Tax=Terriglobus roseus (strain DSM 18391 / NRRL B-41598 / KBS 63) TaxID=926566 RepID=I3ZK43_TERRK|nr:glutamate racemase [Terriglobus roseus DSM 18391]
MSERPVIGVFDSGFGGLTVLRELLKHLPGADFVYLGDTAHLPYGSKSQAMITRYTHAAIFELVSHGAQLVVIACNTASALALPSLQASAPVPLVGVIGPGAEAAAAIAPAGGTAVVLATEATVASHAYAQACAAAGLSAVEKACPLFVPLVEEGWIDGSITEQIAEVYLREALSLTEEMPAAIVLGCTHYPLLRPLLGRVVERIAGNVPIVDSAEATARRTALVLPDAVADTGVEPAIRFFATDSAAKFARLGPSFLGRAIEHVETVDLDG